MLTRRIFLLKRLEEVILGDTSDENKNASINAPTAKANAEGISPVITAIQKELEIVIKISWKVYFALIAIIILKYSISSAFWQAILEILMITIGIFLIQTSIKRIKKATKVKGESKTESRSNMSISDT